MQNNNEEKLTSHNPNSRGCWWDVDGQLRQSNTDADDDSTRDDSTRDDSTRDNETRDDSTRDDGTGHNGTSHESNALRHNNNRKSDFWL
jgi:hypothetical protein